MRRDRVSAVIILALVAAAFVAVPAAGVAGFVLTGNPLWLALATTLLLLKG